MPCPPNMRRVSTTPRGSKRSRMASASTALPGGKELRLGGRDRDGFATAAGRGLVRIVEDELRRELGGLEVHLRPEQEQHGLGVDEDLHALVLDDVLTGLAALGVLHRVRHAGAAAV